MVLESLKLGCWRSHRLGRELGILEVILHLTFRLGSVVHELDEVRVRLEIRNLLDRMIGSVQETCHSLLIIFRDIGSYHGNLHFLVILFNALGSLLEESEFLKEVAVVVVWHESCSHDILHLRPSSDGWFTS